MHWVDTVAEELSKKGKKHIIASGTSISGQIHIGNAGDVIIADGVCRGIKERGGQADVIWIKDDCDALRSIPAQIPKEFNAYIGMPVSKLPCPDGCCASFVEHYTRHFIEAIHRLGIKPEIISDRELYMAGRYEPFTRVALERAQEIRKILFDISGAEKPLDWLPFEPICEKCNKIATTHAYKFDGENVFYKCTGGIAGKKKIDGCGYEGSTNLRNGKLTWRVEWAARWKFLNVTCEPFGKEHSASGGSYDTAKVISEKLFSYPSPHPIFYEHIMVAGKKMSKSLGNVITTEEILSCAEPQTAKYLFFRTKPTKHKDIDMGLGLLKLIEDYERAERIYYDREKIRLEKELPDIKRAYELSQTEEIEKEFFQVEYAHLLILAQVKKDFNAVLETVRRAKKVDNYQLERLKLKYSLALGWLGKYAPDRIKITLQEKLPSVELDNAQKKFLAKLYAELKNVSWEPEPIHNKIHRISAEAGLEPKKAFSAIYQIMLARTEGPRMGYFISSLDRAFVIKRIEEACSFSR